MPEYNFGEQRGVRGVAIFLATLAGTAAATPPLEQPPLIEESPATAPLYSAYVAAGLLPEPQLKTATKLNPLPRDSNDPHPVFVSADKIHGVNDTEMVAEGGVELRQFGTIIDANRITYWQPQEETEALGDVRLRREGDVFSGPRLRLKINDSVGFFETPQYRIRRNVLETQAEVPTPGFIGVPEISAEPTRTTVASGHAERADFEGKDHYKLTHATYSTCKPASPDGSPDWYADVDELKLDYVQNIGEASHAKVLFRGVPILYTPWTNFSLNNQRKSGLLTPTLGSTNKSGAEYVQPYYWNIAPDMDATISSRLLTKRGVQWNGEFRYLEPTFNGMTQVEYLPNDRMTGTNRTSYSVLHNQNLGNGFAAGLNMNGVSDDTYFSDLSSGIASTSQGNLLRQGTLSYGSSWWNATALVQHYQTLQDPALPPVTEPYRRLPQLSIAASRPDLPYGSAFAFSGEFVNFSQPVLDTGKRLSAYPQIALPLQTAAFYLTPKLGYSSTQYVLDRQTTTGPDRVSRNVPIFSVDGGVVMERPTEWFDRAVSQTLEPRLYYLYVPVRDQSQIPVFDTGVADFNFAQIFSENRYSGGDRIGDANQLTAAVTSRIIDPQSGAELLRAALGQRYYFATQQVTLPGEVVRSGHVADILGSLSGQMWGKMYLDTAVQYNPRDRQIEQFNFGGRYQPEQGKVINAGYRYSNSVLSQIDISGQWPLKGGWNGVGRYNYSVIDHRLIESVAGVEYDGGCWTLRFVVHRIATALQAANTAFFVQLELNDFSRIGSNPLDILKRNVPGYGRFGQQSTDSAFTND